MFVNWKKVIGVALRGDSKLSTFVAKDSSGLPVIGSLKLQAGLFPAIEWHQIGGRDRNFSDDTVDQRSYNFQISIYTRDGSHVLIENEVDRIMRDLGFVCYFDHEAYEQDTKVYSRYLSYRITVTRDMAERFNK